MQTFKITFKLKNQISFIDIPTFDGVLAYAYAKEKLPGCDFAQKLSFSKDEILDFSEMPISKHEKGYFLASFMFFDESKAIEHIQKWRKRWDNKHDYIADFDGKVRKVRIDAADFKSYDIPLRVIAIDKIWFYFVSENVNEVERLISRHIYFLGKKRSQGYGEIANFEIEKSDFDFKTIFRPIPIDFVEKNSTFVSEIRYCSWQPPYWLPENFTQCAVK